MAIANEIPVKKIPKTCATCTHRKRPVCLTLKFIRACRRISQNPDSVNAAALTTLILEAESLRNRKYKCAKERNAWTHLMDKGCAFWLPTEDAQSPIGLKS